MLKITSILFFPNQVPIRHSSPSSPGQLYWKIQQSPLQNLHCSENERKVFSLSFTRQTCKTQSTSIMYVEMKFQQQSCSMVQVFFSQQFNKQECDSNNCFRSGHKAISKKGNSTDLQVPCAVNLRQRLFLHRSRFCYSLNIKSLAFKKGYKRKLMCQQVLIMIRKINNNNRD